MASLAAEQGLWGMQAQYLWPLGSAVAAPGLQSAGSVLVGTGLVALWPVGSSRAGHGTRVPCIGRRILSHKESHYFLVRMLQVLQAALMLTDT